MSHQCFRVYRSIFGAQSRLAFLDQSQRQVDQSIRLARPESRLERYGLPGSHC